METASLPLQLRRSALSLEDYDDALNLALGAGKYFDIDAKNQYVETMLAMALTDTYSAGKVAG